MYATIAITKHSLPTYMNDITYYSSCWPAVPSPWVSNLYGYRTSMWLVPITTACGCLAYNKMLHQSEHAPNYHSLNLFLLFVLFCHRGARSSGIISWCVLQTITATTKNNHYYFLKCLNTLRNIDRSFLLLYFLEYYITLLGCICFEFNILRSSIWICSKSCANNLQTAHPCFLILGSECICTMCDNFTYSMCAKLWGTETGRGMFKEMEQCNDNTVSE